MSGDLKDDCASINLFFFLGKLSYEPVSQVQRHPQLVLPGEEEGRVEELPREADADLPRGREVLGQGVAGVLFGR